MRLAPRQPGHGSGARPGSSQQPGFVYHTHLKLKWTEAEVLKGPVGAEFPDLKLQKRESFKDSSDLAPVESDNRAFLLPGVDGRG